MKWRIDGVSKKGKSTTRNGDAEAGGAGPCGMSPCNTDAVVCRHECSRGPQIGGQFFHGRAGAREHGNLPAGDLYQFGPGYKARREILMGKNPRER